jgi:hypothetical protein
MQEQQALTFKAKSGDEIRRFSVPASADWNEIIRKINTIFSVGNNERISVRYEDDEKEWITIDSSAELEEVKRMYGSQCVKLEITKHASYVATTSSPQESTRNAVLDDSSNNWRGKRKEWKPKEGMRDISKEELAQKLALLEERGFKCKWRNIKMLKMNNGDVEKVCEIYLEHKNRKNKFAEEMKILQEKGFDEPIINFKLLKRYEGNVEKVVDILTKAKKFEGNESSCHKWMAIRLLIKYDGNLEEVEKVWQKKQERLLQKATHNREKQMHKSESKWKERQDHCRNKHRKVKK